MQKRLSAVIYIIMLLQACGSGTGDLQSGQLLSNEPSEVIYSSQNFQVYAHDLMTARKVALRAEEARRDLTQDWFERMAPEWAERAKVYVLEGLDYYGVTSYNLAKGATDPYDWEVKLLDQSWGVLGDVVLPHELSHVVFAESFRSRLPRWLDEGAALLAEPEAYVTRQFSKLGNYRVNDRSFSVSELFAIRDYPANNINSFYTHSGSLVKYMVDNLGGRRKFVTFVQTGIELDDDWERALQEVYGLCSSKLEEQWLQSVKLVVDI